MDNPDPILPYHRRDPAPPIDWAEVVYPAILLALAAYLLIDWMSALWT